MKRGAQSLTLAQAVPGGVGHGAVTRLPTRAMGGVMKRGTESPTLGKATQGAVGSDAVTRVPTRVVGGVVQRDAKLL